MSQTTASLTTASAKPISPLRRRMIEDMTVRGFGEKTQAITSVMLRTSQSSSAGRRTRPRVRTCAGSNSTSASRACSRRR